MTPKKPTKSTATRGSRKVTTLVYKAEPKTKSTSRGKLEIKTTRRGNVTTVEYLSPVAKKKAKKAAAPKAKKDTFDSFKLPHKDPKDKRTFYVTGFKFDKNHGKSIKENLIRFETAKLYAISNLNKGSADYVSIGRKDEYLGISTSGLLCTVIRKGEKKKYFDYYKRVWGISDKEYFKNIIAI